jgi:hypothetical protein
MPPFCYVTLLYRIHLEKGRPFRRDGWCKGRCATYFRGAFFISFVSPMQAVNIRCTDRIAVASRYVCERLRPEVTRVRGWLERLVNALLKAGVPAERRDDVAAAILLLLGMWQEASGYRWARDCLLRLNVDFSGDIPSTKGVQGFQSILSPDVPLDELWAGLQRIRTYPEQVRAYLTALKNGKPATGYGEFAKEAREEWPILEEAFASETSRKRILQLSHWRESCPHCQISLPTSEVFKLQSLRVATAKNCCRRILIWTGD